MLKEFREFAFKGNVIDLATGVVIGAAFNKIVTAVVDDLIMPFVGLALPAGDWRSAAIVLRASPDPAQPAQALRITYGHLLGVLIDFLIIAFVLFLVISRIVRRKKEAPPPTAETRQCPACLEIIAKNALRCKHCTQDLGYAR